MGRKYLGAKTLIKGLQEAPGHVHGGKPCGGPLCLPHLCTPPIIPHTVYGGVVQVRFWIYLYVIVSEMFLMIKSKER